MNICFLSGKIINTPEFRFVLNNKQKMIKKLHICILLVDLQIDDKSIFKLKLYDDIAEFGYKNFNINDEIIVYGTINSVYEIDVNGCFKVKLSK